MACFAFALPSGEEGLVCNCHEYTDNLGRKSKRPVSTSFWRTPQASLRRRSSRAFDRVARNVRHFLKCSMNSAIEY
jgi:hypothetical protein